MSDSADDWSPPSEIEEYRLLTPLGRGAMGQVFLAHDTLLDRKVAVKFIAGGTPDPALREQFIIEARAIARLCHPNVVAIHRVGEVRRRPYLVSEFVHGRTLAELPKPVTPSRLVEIGLGLARGLAAAHRRGVLHRDLKPANAMITDDGEIKLLDFGLAKLIDRPGVTVPSSAVVDALASGARVGSPLYMAPEIWRGEPATPASDVYSIGVFLYELAAGRAPNDDASLSELPRLSQDRDVAPLHRVAPDVDERLCAVVDRCLRRDPSRRWASGDALREALEALAVAARAAVPEGNPYRGLQPFDAEHQGLFFGRGAETRAIVDRLRSEPLVVVAGDSGVGKSSLCRAGVLPLVEGRLVQLVPGRRPIAALCAAVAPLLAERGAGGDETTLETTLREDPTTLARLLRGGEPTVLFVDQLEELATLAPAGEAAVAAEALAAMAVRAPGLRVLATVRSDFLTRLAALPGLGPEVARALYLLPPLSAEGVRDAAVGPAAAKGYQFESPATVDALVAVAAEAGGLPLLQFALAQLWEARDVERKLIPAAAVDRMGGPAGALARHGDGVLAALVPAERAAAQRILVHLVTAEGTRARRGDGDLVAGDAVARAALEALVRSRLVVAREDAYELAHEALITRWDTLRSWLSHDVERRAIAQRLERAAIEWERLGRAREALWQRKQLAEAEQVAPAGSREQAFLAASRRAARRSRALAWAAAVGLPAIVLGVYAMSGVMSRRDVARRVAGYRTQAEAAFGRARAAGGDFTRLRDEANRRFDAMDRPGGEASWKDALAAARRASTEAQAASDAFETALRVDPTRRDVRDRFGDLLVARAELAEATFQPATRDEFLARLPLNDEDGSRRAAWSRPTEVSLDAPPGAALALFRYDDDNGHRHAVPLPAPASSRLLLPAGSYLAVAGEVRLPFAVARGEARRRVALVAPRGPVPAGFAWVPPGRFLFGSSGYEEMRRTFFGAPPLHAVEGHGFFIARAETTYADWIAFLDALTADERARLTPRGTNFEGVGVELRKAGATWELALRPKEHVYRARWGEPIHYRDRQSHAEQDWRKMPVSGVSFHMAEAYARWLAASGRVPGARLCTEMEWQRAARGADDREYPHGDRLDPEDADFDLSYGQKMDAFGPDEVGSHPASRSPFGVDDMVGNIYEWARSSLTPDETVVLGGTYYYNREMSRVYNREVINPDDRTQMLGVRVCADPS